MYESFYGLREKPFDLHPDPEYLYMSEGHEEAYIHLRYGIEESKGLVVVTGEIGSGKTTLINFLLRKLEQNVHVGVIKNTTVSPLEFISMVGEEFGLNVSGREKPGILKALNRYLLERSADKDRVVLIVDEAQNLPLETVEEIRLLSNMEAEKSHLLQVILLGQPELKEKLRQKGLEQFVQRVTVHSHLGGLSREEVKQYVRHRLRVAGAENLEIFDDAALGAVHQYARGTPRLVNTLCDTALVHGFAEQRKVIEPSTIDDVVAERRAGGLFFAPTEDDSGATAISAEGLPEHLEERLQSTERRLHELEGRAEFLQSVSDVSRRANRQLFETIKALKRRVDTLWKQATERSQDEERVDHDANGTPAKPFFRVYGRGPRARS